eukprot:CAMPEP_0172471486 /NCGR_PEP_ID=MMETSP1065-20121228/67844_1 /TAXON_ID=265537 /ORGANISM="Amphiprora paludosa, Strain CCMP125" /LENGTH=441 /DNA_ID=CAMNT_0013229589 /DNA_START=74 /DNA_END=1399 /DNA_ORIENTATION=-
MKLSTRSTTTLFLAMAATAVQADTVASGEAVVDAMGQITTDETALPTDEQNKASLVMNATVEEETPAAEQEEEIEFEYEEGEEEYEEEEEEYDEDYDIWEEEGPGRDFGVAQAAHPDEVQDTDPFEAKDVETLLEETQTYMDEIVAKDDAIYGETREYCLNYYQLCSIWAVIGECETNPEFMIDECGPACKSCDKITVTEEDKAALLEQFEYEEGEGEYEEYEEEEGEEYEEDKAALLEQFEYEEGEGEYEEYEEEEGEEYEEEEEVSEEVAEEEVAEETTEEEATEEEIVEEAIEEEIATEEEEEEEVLLEGPGSEFGAVQDLDPEMAHEEAMPKFTEQDVLDRIALTADYMTNKVMVEDMYAEYRELCWNYYSMCTIWAVTNECELNPEFMEDECAPACYSCEKIDLEAADEESYEEEEELEEEESLTQEEVIPEAVAA